MKWKQAFPILTILLLGLLLRCINISGRGLWYDDAFSIFLAQQDYPSIVSGTAADTMPPLYYFLLHLFLGISHQVWWLRLINIVLSLGNIYLLYRLVHRLAGNTAGLAAALLAAISPIHVYHAQELRMYTLLVFGQLLYAWNFTRIWLPEGSEAGKKAVWINWIGLVIGGGIAMYAHNLAIFTLVIPNMVLVLRREWRSLFHLVGAQVLILAVAIPWLIMVPGQVDKIQTAFWTPRPGIVEIIQAIVVFTAAIPLPGFWQVLAILVSFEVLVFVCLGLFQKRNELKSQTGLLLSFALLPPLLMFIVSYFMRPIFVPRGFLFSSLAYFGLAGMVFSIRQSRRSGWLVLIGFILASVLSLPFQTGFKAFPRSPYRQAMAAIQPFIEPGDIVIHDNKLSYFPSYYYAPEIPQRFLADEPGSHNDTLALASQQAMMIFPEPDLLTAIGQSDRVFFVVFERAIAEYKQMGESGHLHLVWLENNRSLVRQWQFGDLGIYLFDDGL